MDLLSLQINKEERDWSEIDSVAVIISENIGSILTFRMKGYLVILWRSKQSNTYILCMLFVIRHLIETALTYLGEVLQQSWYFNIVFIEYVFSVFLNELTIPENCWYIEQVSLSVVYSRFLEDWGAQPTCVAVSPV